MLQQKLYFSCFREVMYDHEQNLPYDVILSKIDVRSLLFDMYNFYKMQVRKVDILNEILVTSYRKK